eukprot:SAG31_NODE_3568_length_4117_cov_2.260080_3_plen_159_part_00
MQQSNDDSLDAECGGVQEHSSSAEIAEEPIPLVSCLSPQCLSYLPGKLSDLEQLSFYPDAELSRLARKIDPEGQMRALPSFRPEFKLQKNPKKRVGNSSGEPTIIKSEEQLAILAKWWNERVTPRDMSGTFVDQKEKQRLAVRCRSTIAFYHCLRHAI